MDRSTVERLRVGEISFEEFLQRTTRDWTRLAQHLYGVWRCRLPSSVTVEDVRQEMMLGALVKWPAYDETRSDLDAYLRFQATDAAKTMMNRARRAYKLRSNAPSRHDVLVGSTTEGQQEAFDVLVYRETDRSNDPEQQLMAVQELRLMRA